MSTQTETGQVFIFPGSHLYDRRATYVKPGAATEKVKQPPWIVAGEIVQPARAA